MLSLVQGDREFSDVREAAVVNDNYSGGMAHHHQMHPIEKLSM